MVIWDGYQHVKKLQNNRPARCAGQWNWVSLILADSHMRRPRYIICQMFKPLQWRHNGRDGVSNHQPHHWLLNRLFRRRSQKNESSASLAFVRGIHRWPVNSPHKWPVTRKMFPFDDVIMHIVQASCVTLTTPGTFTYNLVNGNYLIKIRNIRNISFLKYY